MEERQRRVPEVAVAPEEGFPPTLERVVEPAREIGALPHDGDLLHRLFLYHLALNGVSVVRSMTP